MSLPVNPAPLTMFASPPTLGELATIVGIPLEYSGVGRPGSRLAPAALREASVSVTPYSRRSGVYLEAGKLGDIGDVVVEDVGGAFERIGAVYKWLLSRGTIPVLIGGEHSVTYGVALALREYRRPLVVILDAHLDAANSYRGYTIASPTVTLRVAELLGGGRVVHIGARSYHPREAERLRRLGVVLLGGEEVDKLRELVRGSEIVHVSIDVDILDPCYEPGAVTPEPEGITPTRLYDIVYAVFTSAEKVSMDIVEYTPLYDPARIGAVYAVKTIVEGLGARLASGTSQARR